MTSETILEFHELKRIYDYLAISSKKNDTLLPKIKSVIAQMQECHHPFCRITVEEDKK